jgi:parallel beta-helix repeat protein
VRRLVVIVASGLLVVGLARPASARADRTLIVRPGESIQAAVDAASPGDRILVLPGTYIEAGRPCTVHPADMCAVVITKDDITLMAPLGAGQVVVRSDGGQAVGIEVARSGDAGCLSDGSQRISGSTLSGITVSGFEDDGVLLFCVDRWRITRSAAHDNGEYGFFPSHVGMGRIDHSTATDANDTGIYIGQSHDVLIDHDVATRNVSGFEIENSLRVRATGNLATGNTGGILSFTLPFLDVTMNDRNLIDHNTVVANNKPNTCEEPGDDVCAVPAGSGIALVGADHNAVAHNRVLGNNTFGIVVANVCSALRIPPEICAVLDIEPNPDGDRIVHNTVLGNGASPEPTFPLPAVDLGWDGTGTDNCWSHNAFGTSFPDALPACR